MDIEQRHRYVRKISTVGETTISDHKPKKIIVEIKNWHWKTEEKKRIPKIRWEGLRDEDVARQFKFKVEKLLENRNVEVDDRVEEKTGWEEISSVTIVAAKEICGEQDKRVENPWMKGFKSLRAG